MAEDKMRGFATWDAPIFNLGDVVEVISYDEWKGDYQRIAKIERAIRHGEDCGYWLYSTHPLDRKEGMTDEWKAEHLQLIKPALAAQPRVTVDEVADVLMRQFRKSTPNVRQFNDGWVIYDGQFNVLAVAQALRNAFPHMFRG